MTDWNEVERARWGGPSPFAGRDTRTDAQIRHAMELLAELYWAPYQEFGIPARAAESPEAPAGPIVVMSTSWRRRPSGGEDVIIYWQRP